MPIFCAKHKTLVLLLSNYWLQLLANSFDTPLRVENYESGLAPLYYHVYFEV